MIRPLQQDDALLNDIQSKPDTTEGFRVWWLGQSGFLVQWQGKHLLFDPYLSDSLSTKYEKTDKPHTRISHRVIDPARLPRIDVVTSSHNHTDHLDADTLKPILAANPAIQLLIPEANRAFVADRLGCPIAFPLGINAGESLTLEGFEVIGVAAAHNTIERDELEQCKYLGYIARFGPFTVYHSGDTLWYPGLETLLQPYQVDLALLPINGNLPERRVAGNMNAQEAAEFGKVIGAKLVIPHHYDLFAFNTEDPQRFVEATAAFGTPYRVLQLGEKASVGY